jgi:hypothetical protein
MCIFRTALSVAATVISTPTRQVNCKMVPL